MRGAARLLVTLAIAAIVIATPERAAAEPDPKSDHRVARELFKKGITAYNLGDYDRAIGDLRRAYELSQEPQLLFNIAQALRAKRDYGQALIFYRNYLRLVPDAANRADAESLAVEMEHQAAAQDKAALDSKRADDARRAEETRLQEAVKRAEALRLAAEATAAAERERAAIVLARREAEPSGKRPVYKRWWLWTTVGVVAVGIGVGVGLGVGLVKTKTVLPMGSLGTIDGR